MNNILLHEITLTHFGVLMLEILTFIVINGWVLYLVYKKAFLKELGKQEILIKTIGEKTTEIEKAQLAFVKQKEDEKNKSKTEFLTKQEKIKKEVEKEYITEIGNLKKWLDHDFTKVIEGERQQAITEALEKQTKIVEAVKESYNKGLEALKNQLSKDNTTYQTALAELAKRRFDAIEAIYQHLVNLNDYVNHKMRLSGLDDATSKGVLSGFDKLYDETSDYVKKNILYLKYETPDEIREIMNIFHEIKRNYKLSNEYRNGTTITKLRNTQRALTKAAEYEVELGKRFDDLRIKHGPVLKSLQDQAMLKDLQEKYNKEKPNDTPPT